MRREGAWYSRNVHLVFIVLRVIVPRLAAVLADLFVCILIYVTEVAGTADITTVRPVITAVALAETVTTITLIVAVVRTIMNTQSPHVIEHHGWEGVIRRLLLFDAIPDPAEHVDLAQGSRIRRPPAQMRHQNSGMVRPLIRSEVLQTSVQNQRSVRRTLEAIRIFLLFIRIEPGLVGVHPKARISTAVPARRPSSFLRY